MKTIALILGVYSVMMMTGCGSTQLVSSTSTSDSDSTVVKIESKKDSSSFKETVEAKVIPGTSVDASLTPGKLDSLIKSLKGLPTSVTRTIYLTDPKMQTRISLLIDSLGNAILRCSDQDEVYYQVTRELTRIIEAKEAEIKRIKSESVKVSESKEVIQKGFFATIWDGAKWVFIALVAFVVCGTIFYIKTKFFS